MYDVDYADKYIKRILENEKLHFKAIYSLS